MTERASKTIGLKTEVHRELKRLCADNDWTMSEAIAHMMQVLKETKKNGTKNRKPD